VYFFILLWISPVNSPIRISCEASQEASFHFFISVIFGYFWKFLTKKHKSVTLCFFTFCLRQRIPKENIKKGANFKKDLKNTLFFTFAHFCDFWILFSANDRSQNWWWQIVPNKNVKNVTFCKKSQNQTEMSKTRILIFSPLDFGSKSMFLDPFKFDPFFYSLFWLFAVFRKMEKGQISESVKWGILGTINWQ